MLSDRCEAALLAWDFDLAMSYVVDEEATDWEMTGINALCHTFGKVGAIAGLMGDIITAAVHGILHQPTETELHTWSRNLP